MSTEFDVLSEKYKHILVDQDEVDKVEILKQGPNWNSLGSAFISPEDLKLITAYDQKISDKPELLQKYGADIARILMITLAKFAKSEDIKYVVTLVYDVINFRNEVPEVANYFFALSNLPERQDVGSLPFAPLFALLSRQTDEPYIVSRVGAILTEFLVSFPKVHKDDVQKAITWFKTRLNDDESSPNYFRRQIKVLESLRNLLKHPRYRVLFARENGVKAVSALAAHQVSQDAAKVQLTYEALYCVWLMSFTDSVKEMPAMSDPAMVYNLIFLLRTVESEKIIRMSLGILRNLLSVTTEESQLNNEYFIQNARRMISYGLPVVLQQLKIRHSIQADPDQKENVEELIKSLAKIVDDLTSFEVYKNEVLSRKLDWNSPSHKSQTFWTTNVLKFEENNDEVLNVLNSILMNADKTADDTTLAVACWDIGEFVRFHPRGKHIANTLNFKLPILKYLAHKDENLASEALRALQKIMIVNWEYLSV